jgi:hypothetical protein
MFFDGAFRPSRNVNHHALEIVNCFIALVGLESEGRLRLVGVATEPDCWATVGGVELKPDLRVDYDRAGQGLSLLWLEVDLATEGQKQIRRKLDGYWRAYNDADVSAWPIFPRVLWVAIDDERVKELRWLVEQMPEQARPLFDVTSITGLHAYLS